MKIIKFILRCLINFFFFLIFGICFLYHRKGNKKYHLSGRTMIISNHFSDFDMMYIYLLYGYKKHLTFVAYEGIKQGFSKIFAFAYDCIIVYEDKLKNIASIKQMIKTLEDDGILIIFPEGYIDCDKESLYPFSETYLFVAKKAKAKILCLSMYPIQFPFVFSKIYIGEEISYQHLEETERSILNNEIQDHIKMNLIKMGVDMRKNPTS